MRKTKKDHEDHFDHYEDMIRLEKLDPYEALIKSDNLIKKNSKITE